MTRILLLGVALLAAGCGDGGNWTKTLSSGVKYEDLAEGRGEPVKAGDNLLIHYTGWLAQGGKEFDSSVGKSPFEFRLGAGRVIKGWDEGVAGMKPGGKRKLFIPAAMAYGEEARGDKIPANSDLMFEVHLVGTVAGFDGEAESAKWKKTASGLRYDDVKQGDGPPAKAGDRVFVHYTGRLAQGGMQFDSSVGRGRPFDFVLGLGKVIKGWDEGVAGMKPGGKRKLFIPSELGYGEVGAGEDIPPGADLMFDVELLEIEDSSKKEKK